MRVKMIASAVIAGAALSLPLARVSPANAAAVPVVYIHVIQYSPAGPDVPVTTAKLDGEWVLLTNTTGKSVSLTQWTLRDKANHIYVFPAFVLKAHKSVEIHTGTGKNKAANLYWATSRRILLAMCGTTAVRKPLPSKTRPERPSTPEAIPADPSAAQPRLSSSRKARVG